MTIDGAPKTATHCDTKAHPTVSAEMSGIGMASGKHVKRSIGTGYLRMEVGVLLCQCVHGRNVRLALKKYPVEFWRVGVLLSVDKQGMSWPKILHLY